MVSAATKVSVRESEVVNKVIAENQTPYFTGLEEYP